MSALEGRDAAVVLVDRKPAGIVTRQDLLRSPGRRFGP
ncbi:hypothetical protein [Streptomyces tricolor]